MIQTNMILEFGSGANNSKLAKLEKRLNKKVYTFSLPAGYSCPGADKCQARFDRGTRKVVDGKNQEFRCFAASIEARSPGFAAKNDRNFKLLRETKDIKALILDSLPIDAEIIRVHVSGDFYSEKYFQAWMEVAQMRRDIRFYAYTKSVDFVVDNLAMVPDNFSITASFGGKHDNLIIENNLKSAKVVMSVEEASILGIEIDHDDSHAAVGMSSFALLIHGTQPRKAVTV